MGQDNIVLIAAMETTDAALQAGGDLENRVRAAMRAAKDNWLATDENDQFKAAMAGVARTCDEVELERLNLAIRGANGLLAVMSGDRYVNVGAATDDMAAASAVADPLPLLPLWREIKHGEAVA